jgi:hypothetical protein
MEQIKLFNLLSTSFDEIYTNYLDVNESAILATTRMIRFLSVLVSNEQSMVDDLNLPPYVSITDKCSKA